MVLFIYRWKKERGWFGLQITDVRLKVIDDHNRLKAIAAITIDDCFVIHELRVIEGDNGLFIAMPSKKLQNGEFRDIAHPINSETRELIEQEVLKAYEAQKIQEWVKGTNYSSFYLLFLLLIMQTYVYCYIKIFWYNKSMKRF